MLNNNTSHIPIYETRKFVEIVSRFRPQNVFLVRERSELCCLVENRIARFSSPFAPFSYPLTSDHDLCLRCLMESRACTMNEHTGLMYKSYTS